MSGQNTSSLVIHVPHIHLLMLTRTPILTRDVSNNEATPTATQIETRVAKAKDRWQTPLNESSTPHFPRETDRLYPVVDVSQQKLTDLITATDERSHSPQSPSAQLSKTMQTPMSPSVYSRNTDGLSILPNDSVLSFNSPYEYERTQQGGSAVILTSQSVRSYLIGTPSPNRPSSTRSSRDWKAWLSHEVSAIETTSQEDLTIRKQYTTPSGNDKRALSQNIRTSQTDSEDTTVIIRESFETSTPRAGPDSMVALGTDQSILKSPVSEAHADLSKTPPQCDLTVVSNPRSMPLDQYVVNSHLPTALASTPPTRKDRPDSKPSSSSSQAVLTTPTSARMNERFPFLETSRRSSNTDSSRSRLSKSPSSCEESSSRKPEVPRAPEAVYSDVSIPVFSSTTIDLPGIATKSNEPVQKSKENFTPPSSVGLKRPNVSALGLVQRPKSLQPLSFAALSRSPVNMSNLSSKPIDTSQSKRAPSPAETIVARPGLRVTIRPSSPEKLSRRPRSAFDLCHSSSPRPASELRRPALQYRVSSSVLTGHESSKPDVQTPEHGLQDANQRDGSVTPGQRMAERFLKERKSTTVLERGVRKSTGKFVREDTPAFL